MDERDYKECRRELESVNQKARELAASIGIDALKEELSKLEKENMDGNLWQDKERYTDVNRRISKLRKKISPWDDLLKEISE